MAAKVNIVDSTNIRSTIIWLHLAPGTMAWSTQHELQNTLYIPNQATLQLLGQRYYQCCVAGSGSAGVWDSALQDQLPAQQSRTAANVRHGHTIHIQVPCVDQGTRPHQLCQVEVRHDSLQGEQGIESGYKRNILL